MTSNFHDRLRKYFADVGMALSDDASAASVFPNTTDKGMSRERIYAELLRQHVPSSYNILFGGFLFAQNGKESRQLDIIVTGDTTIQFNFLNKQGTGKSFACVDGCVAVVSVKSVLDSSGLKDSLQNIASIPDMQPLSKDRLPPFAIIHNYEDMLYKVIYASSGVQLCTALDTLTEFYEEHPEIPLHKRPNLIHVAGEYVIIRTGAKGAKTREGEFIPPNIFYGLPDKTDAVALTETITKIHRIAWSWRYIDIAYDELINHMSFFEE